jgi:uroporphyrinogen-III synthase
LTQTELLENKTLVITRKSEDAKEFLNLVTSAGGVGIALPTIDIVPNLSAIKNAVRLILLGEYDICIFMSPSGVGVLCEYATEYDKIKNLVSVLNAKIVVAQGPMTKKSLQKYGIHVSQIPDRFSSEGIVSLFSKLNLEPGKKIIVPRSGMSNDFVTRSLTNLGLDITELFLYTTRTAIPGKIWNEFIYLFKKSRIDAIVFTSGSSVNSFFEILHRLCCNYHQFLRPSMAIISIGPLTTREFDRRNIYCIEASEHTIRGTLDLAKSLLNSRIR